jgi:hypothetical protein
METGSVPKARANETSVHVSLTGGAAAEAVCRPSAASLLFGGIVHLVSTAILKIARSPGLCGFDSHSLRQVYGGVLKWLNSGGMAPRRSAGSNPVAAFPASHRSVFDPFCGAGTPPIEVS